MNVNRDRIDAALKGLSASGIPSVPANTEQNVWRRIRRGLAEKFSWRPDFWPQWVTNPAFGTGLVAVSAAIGVLMSTAIHDSGRELADTEASSSLSVFSDRAPGMINVGGRRGE